MQALSPSRPRYGSLVLLALVGLMALALASGARLASAALPTPIAPPTCAGFRVLHADRIGAAAFLAGTYAITLEDPSLTCRSSAELFAEFLEAYDGVLPAPWKVTAEGSGQAAFLRAGGPGFSVTLTRKGEEGGKSPDLGTLCKQPFTVGSTVVGPLRFTKGRFLIYLPAGSGITCNRASVLFTGFLGTGGELPPPWKVINQTATFYKPSNPTRSAFRIEPLNGSGRR